MINPFVALGSFLIGTVQHLNGERNRQYQQQERKKDRAFQEEQRNKDRQQDWRKHEEMKQVQRDATDKHCQTLLATAALQRQIALELPEEQKNLEYWPLSLFPSEILKSYRGEGGQMPLRVIPTFLGFEGLELEGGVVTFLERHYPKESHLRAVEVLDGTWKPNRHHGGGSIKSLFGRLHSEPMLLLRTSRRGNEITCRVAYWGMAAEESFDRTLIESQSSRDILLDAVKAKARVWPQERQKYLAAGRCKTEAEVDREYGGNEAWNWQMLEEEESLRAVGIVPKNARAYKITDEDKQAVRRVLTACHCLLAGLFTDCHYLIYNNTPPKLPSLLPELTEGIVGLPMVREAVRQTIQGYRGAFQALKQDRALLVPDFALELAAALADFDGEWAKEELDYSLRSWLETRGGAEEDVELLAAVESALQIGDLGYMARLQELYERLGEGEMAEQMQVLVTWVGALEAAAEQKEELDYSLRSWLETRGGAEEDVELLAAVESALQIGDLGYMARLQELYERLGEGEMAEQMQALVTRVGALEAAAEQAEQTRQTRAAELVRQTELDCGNGVILEVVPLEAGSFLMGSPDGKGRDSERPQHRVTVERFAIGKYPVTQQQWFAVMGEYLSESSWERGGKPYWQGDNLPIESVTWHEAKEFCQRLAAKTGREVRLPSEAEWEYACRAGSDTEYCFGDDSGRLGKYAWYTDNSARTHPVGKKKPNAWGLYDMHGNVWEWCEDRGHENYQGAPNDGTAWLSHDKNTLGSKRVQRGGSWNDYSGNWRSASRTWGPDTYEDVNIGFRVVVSP